MLETELQLIARAKKGDAQAFGALYDYYVAQIYRFVVVKVTHKETAEDLTHEVFLSAWQNLPNYTFRGFPFSSWLYAIARHRIIDHYRTRKVYSPIEEIHEQFVRVENDREAEFDLKIELAAVKRALAKLPIDHQDVLILRFVEDFSPKEIAEILGKSEGNIRIIQHRAINNLKKHLTDDN